jgi:hypothetical protein
MSGDIGCDLCTGRFSDGFLPAGWIYATDIDIEAGSYDEIIERTDGERAKCRRCGCNPAPEVVSGWPDEATVERVAEAIATMFARCTLETLTPTTRNLVARAALSVLPDPTADTVLLGEDGTP